MRNGTQATTYESYQGNSYRVDLGGKNLYYIAPETKNGVTLSYDSDGAMVLNGKSTASFTAFTRVVKYSGTYTLSTSNTQTQGNTFVRTRNSSNTILHSLLLNVTSRQQTVTNNDIAIFEITIGAENVEYNNFKIYVQLENGSIVTPYSPYTANPIELCKIGNYQDRIYYDSGKWYIEKNIGKKVFVGVNADDGTWSAQTGYYQCNASLGSNSSAGALCSHYNYGNISTLNNFTITTNAFRVNDSTDTLTNFKAWLVNNNVTLYYVLATPTTTEITDNYLLNQLNGLLDMQLYENLCYVDWVGSEAPTMKLFYNYLKLTGTHNLTVRKADLVDTYPITFDGDYELDEGDTIAFTNGEWQFNGTAITDTDLVTQLNATRHMDLFQNTNYITLNNDVTLTVAIIPNSVDFVLAQDENGLFSVKHGDVLFIDKQGYGIKLQFKIGNSYFTLADTDGVINYTGATPRVIKRILLTIPTDTSISNDLARFRLYKGTEADNTYPITLGSLVIGNGDYLHNEAGKWKLNTTEITDSTLLANLRAIERLKLYDGETNYINWHGANKITMILQYFYKEGDSE